MVVTMNDEVKRFFASINYQSEFFNEATIEKVILNKKSGSFEIFVNVPNIIPIAEVNNLFLCAQNGINGQNPCHIH